MAVITCRTYSLFDSDKQGDNIIVTNNFDNLHLKQERKPDIKDVKFLQDLIILVVDDNEDNLTLLQVALEIYGAKVVTASNVATAFELIKKVKFNILITDIAMPEEDGFSLLQKIRALSNYPNQGILAIAFSAYEPESLNFPLNDGFQAYITKPLAPDKLIATIKELLK